MRSTTGDSDKRVVGIPYYIQDGIGRRQCTNEFKLAPIRKFIRQQYAPWKKGEYVETWIGISKDESTRMKDSRLKYMVNKWPLIDMNMDRQACKDWMEKHGFPIPPKSSCVGCPFHNDELWLEMKRKYPDEWNDAVAMDKRLRKMRGMKWPQFMHRSLIDLDKVDLREDQLNLFENECTGMCAT